MEELYLLIADRLKKTVPGLKTIDEDTGQLLETGDQYPVLFPCALVDVQSIDWNTDKSFNQRGTLSVTIKHAFNCYEDTHFSSPVGFDRLKERTTQHHTLCSALHCYNFMPKKMSSMIRAHSRNYTLLGRIKVYEVTFILKIEDSLVPIE